VHVRPDGDTLEVNATDPVNPLTGDTVIVEVAGVPPVVVTAVGLAAIVKSVGVKVTVAEWDKVPLVPVTVAVKLIGVPLVQDRVDDVSATVPVKPLTGATVIVDAPELPGP